MTDLQMLHARLEDLAYHVTEPFCYGCYIKVEGENCPRCGSDDLMRHLEGVGVEYGTEWIIESLIENNCEPINEEEAYSELLDEIYGEVQFDGIVFYPSDIIRELDPVAFRCGCNDYLAAEESDGQLYEVNGRYYRLYDIEEMIADLDC
ncbi:hypothetical protein STSP2_01958 [Anaerohalosphaera lusitana]|uniref:Uncharacterized protein n=1 Tax=Anaerohalosphaera lusitana TaxID=1936003 RepID=A0A1U9NLS6_9BACT|nr:hypothetical protein [Anaerohalosphaera lusitana]AQT68785.1 hypothetical protein STSP2_01958 [Anaerohalosphaera lusitana]